MYGFDHDYLILSIAKIQDFSHTQTAQANK